MAEADLWISSRAILSSTSLFTGKLRFADIVLRDARGREGPSGFGQRIAIDRSYFNIPRVQQLTQLQ